MPHLDIAYTGPGIAVPTWRNGTDDPWATLEFSAASAYGEYFDDGHHHADGGGPSFVNGHAFIHGSLILRLEGMPVSQCQIRPYLVLADGSGQRASTSAIFKMALDEETTDTDHDPAVTHYAVPIDIHVPAGRRLRLEMMQAHQTSDFPDGLIKYAHLVARVDEL